jgi:hypothetical protein
MPWLPCHAVSIRVAEAVARVPSLRVRFYDVVSLYQPLPEVLPARGTVPADCCRLRCGFGQQRALHEAVLNTCVRYRSWRSACKRSCGRLRSATRHWIRRQAS